MVKKDKAFGLQLEVVYYDVMFSHSGTCQPLGVCVHR